MYLGIYLCNFKWATPISSGASSTALLSQRISPSATLCTEPKSDTLHAEQVPRMCKPPQMQETRGASMFELLNIKQNQQTDATLNITSSWCEVLQKETFRAQPVSKSSKFWHLHQNWCSSSVSFQQSYLQVENKSCLSITASLSERSASSPAVYIELIAKLTLHWEKPVYSSSKVLPLHLTSVRWSCSLVSEWGRVFADQKCRPLNNFV